jgi:hypothetical protein
MLSAISSLQEIGEDSELLVGAVLAARLAQAEDEDVQGCDTQKGGEHGRDHAASV